MTEVAILILSFIKYTTSFKYSKPAAEVSHFWMSQLQMVHVHISLKCLYKQGVTMETTIKPIS